MSIQSQRWHPNILHVSKDMFWEYMYNKEINCRVIPVAGDDIVQSEEVQTTGVPISHLRVSIAP